MWLSQVDIVSSKQVVNSRKARKRCSPFYLTRRKTLDFVAARLSMPRTAGGGGEISVWLNGIDRGLAQYTSTFVDYGAETVEHLRLLDIEDVNNIGTRLSAAGARPLQTKWIIRELKQVADVGGTPGTAPASAPRGAHARERARNRILRGRDGVTRVTRAVQLWTGCGGRGGRRGRGGGGGGRE